MNPDNTINLEGKTINVNTGIIINEKEEKVPFGEFILDVPDGKELELKTSFVGYDYMIKFNNVNYEDKSEYPVNLGTFFSNLCNQVGLEAGNTDFVNADLIINGNPFGTDEYKNIKCKEVLSYIAEIAGGFAKIGRDNKVYIVTTKKILSNLLKVKDVNLMTVEQLNNTPIGILQFSNNIETNPDFSIDGNNYFDDFIKSNEYGEINAITLAVTDMENENITFKDDISIKKNGITEIIIADNPFIINQKDRTKVCQNLWNSLNGVKYLPFKAGYYGYPYIDSGDIIYISDTNDKKYISYILNHTFTYNGGYTGTLETKAMTKTQSKYMSSSESVEKKVKRVERKTDKISGQIEDIIEVETKTEEKISKIVQDADNIKTEVSKKVGKDEIKSSINQSAEDIKISAKNLELEGYTTINNGFSIDKEGNANIAYDTVRINKNGIELADGAKIIGGDGVYCNLQFFPSTDNLTQWGIVGYLEDVGNIYQSFISIYADIPQNFVIQDAYITLRHQPIKWHYIPVATEVTKNGYSRNVQIYTNGLIAFEDIYGASEFVGFSATPGTKTNVLGTNGKTFNANSIEVVKSNSVKNYLSTGNLTVFNIGSITNASSIKSVDDAYAQTGRIIAVLNVLGYLRLAS